MNDLSVDTAAAEGGSHVPGLQTLGFRITGTAPLLMHSDRGLDKSDPDVRAQAKITKKKAGDKTDADDVELQRLDYKLGLYHSPDAGPYIGGPMLEAVIRDAARATRRGKTIERGLQILQDKHPLEYVGPRDIDGLWADARFRDTRGVRVTGRRIMRCRPRFDEWAVEFEVMYDPTLIDEDVLIGIVEAAGRTTGLGDYRPRFGRFDVQVLAA
ncbi:MAG: hypothetical protein ACYTFZ_00225 [Planctomycetota bacterium]|jgi:hypothetical protein